MSELSIKTSHIYPPIPIRQYDWLAYRDGEEERGEYGYGSSEEEAIADLLAIEAERDWDQADAIVTAFEPLAKLARQP